MNFIRQRILLYLVVFFVALNLDFVLPRLVPGNAAMIYASQSKLPAVTVNLISQRLGLGQPIYVQYALYLRGIFSWPPYFGVSYEFYPVPVTTLISERLPWTILLVAVSSALAFSIGYFLAGTSAWRRGGKLEFASMYFSILFWAIPAFWTAMIMIWVFAVKLHWFPMFGNIAFNSSGGLDSVFSILSHAVLPIIALTAAIFGQNYFILRGAAQSILRTDYVIAARTRGLRKSIVAFRYIMRNSILPLVSLLGYSLASLISSALLIEYVFGYSGVGDLVVDAVVNRDYPVVEGCFFFITIIVIAGSFLGDLLLLRLDPTLGKS